MSNHNADLVRRALFQVWGNITPAERQRLEIRDHEQWRQQANGNAASQRNAAAAFDKELDSIIKNIAQHRLDTIANYIRPDEDSDLTPPKRRES
jgi:hypothetical protein